ncbi:hypothetical protein C8R44DRAFT_888004 [Mycena epipterygia]|nr:hypothetical protein C8R44DRAFT_888004 [Mycena epipterygia]
MALPLAAVSCRLPVLDLLSQPSRPENHHSGVPCIPDIVNDRKKYNRNDLERCQFVRNIELMEGSVENYILANNNWKMDIMPKIMDRKNIADFIDPDIAEKPKVFEYKEENCEVESFYNSEEDMLQSLKKSKKNQPQLAPSTGLPTPTHRVHLIMYHSHLGNQS